MNHNYQQQQHQNQAQQPPAQDELERRLQQLLAEREQLRAALEQEQTETFDLRLAMMSTEAEARHEAQKAVKQLQSQVDFQSQELKNAQRELRTALQQIEQLKAESTAAKLKPAAAVPTAVTPTAGPQHAGSAAGSAASSSSKHRFPDIRELSATTRSSVPQTPATLSTPPSKRSCSTGGSSTRLRRDAESTPHTPLFALIPHGTLSVRNDYIVQLLVQDVLPHVAIIIRQLSQSAGLDSEDQSRAKAANANNTFRASSKASEVKLLRSLPRATRAPDSAAAVVSSARTLTGGSARRGRADSAAADALPIAEQLLTVAQQVSLSAHGDEPVLVYPIIHHALDLFSAMFNVQHAELLRPLERMLVALVKCCQPALQSASTAEEAVAATSNDMHTPVLGRLSFDKTPARKQAASPATSSARGKRRRRQQQQQQQQQEEVAIPGSAVSRRKRSRQDSETAVSNGATSLYEPDLGAAPSRPTVHGSSRYVSERLHKMLHKDATVWQYEQYEDAMERTLLLVMKFGHCRSRSDAVASGMVVRIVLAAAEQLLRDDRPGCLQSLLTGDNLTLLTSLMRSSHTHARALLRMFRQLMQRSAMLTHLVDQRAALLWDLTAYLQRPQKADCTDEQQAARLQLALDVVRFIRDIIIQHGALGVAALGVSKSFQKSDLAPSGFRAAHALKMSHTQCTETQTEHVSKELVALPRLLLFAVDCIRELDHAPLHFEADSRYEQLRQSVATVLEILRLLSRHVQLGEIIALLDFRLTGLAIVNRFLNQLVHASLLTHELRADAETLELELNPDDDNDADRLTQSVDMS